MSRSEIDKYCPHWHKVAHYEQVVARYKERIAYYQSGAARTAADKYIVWLHGLLNEAQEKLDAITNQ